MSEPTALPAAPNPASAWAPLSNPVFRMLWAVWLTANVCMWMNDVAAAWLMTSLTSSPVMVALVQSASTLPVFLLGIPSGALADILDRRRYFMVTQFWVAGVAMLLAVVIASDGVTPSLLLALTFLNGIGLAMRWPVFAAIVPELVPRMQLPAALGLNGIAMNASRIVGPIVAGALIAGIGPTYVFVLNALLSLVAGFVIMRWKSERKPSALPGERFVGAIRVGVTYVWQSRRIKAVLLRVFVFFLNSTVLIALLPLEAKRLQGGGAGTFTLLLAAMGAGAIVAVVFLPRLRAALDRNQVVRDGTLLHAGATVCVAFAPSVWLALPAMVVAGMAWISTANSLTISAQLALPNWVRARGMAIYQMFLMGGGAFGAALWGQIATWTDVRSSLLGAAGCALLALMATMRLRVDGGEEEDLTPSTELRPPERSEHVRQEDGPVLVTIEYLIDPLRSEEFRAVMAESRRSRLRLGAVSWELFRDAKDPGRYIEYFVDETWVEHLRRFDRVTASDVTLREKRLAFHIGNEPPKVSRAIAEVVGSA